MKEYQSQDNQILFYINKTYDLVKNVKLIGVFALEEESKNTHATIQNLSKNLELFLMENLIYFKKANHNYNVNIVNIKKLQSELESARINSKEIKKSLSIIRNNLSQIIDFFSTEKVNFYLKNANEKYFDEIILRLRNIKYSIYS